MVKAPAVICFPGRTTCNRAYYYNDRFSGLQRGSLETQMPTRRRRRSVLLR